MRKTVLFVALCLSMIAFAVSYAEATPPSTSATHLIVIISPQNATYNTAAAPFDLPLDFTIDVPKMAMIDSISYKLDGGPDMPITGNTTVPVEYGTHSIVVYAIDILGDTSASDTLYFTVSIECDVNGDGIVSIDDVVIIAGAYGATPEDLNWNPNADIAYHYGRIDIFDLVSVVSHYGETAPQ